MNDITPKIKSWARNTRLRHKQRGFTVQITQKELFKLGIQAYKEGCPLCGCSFEVSCTPVAINSLTLDVVDQTNKVLTPDNVQCICWSCNNEKNLQGMRRNSRPIQTGRISLKWG